MENISLNVVGIGSNIPVSQKQRIDAEIDSVIKDTVKNYQDQNIDQIRMHVKDALVARKKELKLSDKQIVKIISDTKIGEFYKQVTEELKAAAEAAAKPAEVVAKPTAENFRANFVTQPKFKYSGNAAANYYEQFNALRDENTLTDKRRKRIRNAQKRAEADARAAFTSQEYLDSIKQNEAMAEDYRMFNEKDEIERNKETKAYKKMKKKLAKQNIDFADVAVTRDTIERQEREITQSVESRINGKISEAVSSSSGSFTETAVDKAAETTKTIGKKSFGVAILCTFAGALIYNLLQIGKKSA